jgi:kumamolisin
VGGTTALVGTGGTYGEEAVWGEPFEQWGAGGGLSVVFTRPKWQTGPGVDNQYSDGMRQVPDVSAIADSDTGWDVVMGGSWYAGGGGTSAAAPLWAAVAALADQALDERHLPQMGPANPALYDFGSHPGDFPARAFNPVTRGTNLFYPATSTGWNFGTGWGTPNAAGVVDDFIAYERGSR